MTTEEELESLFCPKPPGTTLVTVVGGLELTFWVVEADTGVGLAIPLLVAGCDTDGFRILMFALGEGWCVGWGMYAICPGLRAAEGWNECMAWNGVGALERMSETRLELIDD